MKQMFFYVTWAYHMSTFIHVKMIVYSFGRKIKICLNVRCVRSPNTRLIMQVVKITHKVLRYFPLTPRLWRLYMSRKRVEDMRWHRDKRVDNRISRHPTDSEEWKEFDLQHLEFALEPHNVRLGLAMDGFNTFGNMNNSYNMWHVILIPYNLLPWSVINEQFFYVVLTYSWTPSARK